MVDVTRSNFKELLPQIKKAIDESSFIAIDSEFTGLFLGASNEASLFDSMENRYQKLKERASSFLPCQIGLSTFRKDGEENRYLVETYVFYIRPYMCGSIDRRFMCQASCLDFLCRYDFDFNKFIKEGIPYLNEVDEMEVRKEIEDNTISYNHLRMMASKSKMELDILINNFVKSTSNPSKISSQNDVEANRLVLEKEAICHEYFQINELRRKYPSLKIYSKNKKIIVEKNASNENNNIQSDCKAEEESLIDHYIGFSKIFKHLKLCNKPIVGHNLLMDLLLFFHNFYKPLPKTYEDFKQELHSLFPVIYDTRHIWLHVKKFYKFKEISVQSGLFELFEMFKNPNDSLSTLFSPDVMHSNCDKYRSKQFPHESGYDSYVTGWVFLKICHVLALNKISNPVFVQPQTLKQHLKAVLPFQNKINIARSRIRYIDLGGKDPTPTESQILHIRVRNNERLLNQTEAVKQLLTVLLGICNHIFQCKKYFFYILNHLFELESKIGQHLGLFDKYGLIEFKLNQNRKEAILAIGSLRSFREILKDFSKDPDFDISKYSILRHSPVIKATLWVTSLGICTIAAFYGTKLCFRS